MARPKFSMRWLILIFVALLCMFPVSAFAQSALQTAAKLSNGALDDYDNFELEAADAKIMQATHILEQNNVTEPKAALVYVVQGIVSFGRFKDSAPAIADERAFSAFLKALSIDPTVEIPGDYRSDEIEVVFDRARQTIASAPKSVTIAQKAEPPSIQHTPVATGNHCQPFPIRAVVPAHPDIYRVYLFYAVDNQQGFTQTELHPTLASSDVLVAEIPPLETRGNQVRYYIEAQNRMGEVVAHVSNASLPLTSVFVGECTGLSADDLDSTFGDPLFQLSILAGTAAGVIEGKVLNCTTKGTDKCPNNKVGTGMTILPFHLRVAGMFNLPKDFQIGLYARIQIVNWVSSILDKSEASANNIDFPEQYNIMVGLAVRYLALSKQPYRLYIGAEVGWGGSNATVISSSFKDIMPLYLYEGPVHVAPEIGFLWSFHKNVGLQLELAIPIHFPKKPSVHFDLSLGPYFQF